MHDHSRTRIAGEIETDYRRLGQTRAVKTAGGVAEMMIVKFDLRAVAELIFEVFSQTPAVIDIGFQRRADPVDILHSDSGLLQAKADRTPRQLAARVFCKREALFFRRGNQLSVAQ